MTGPVVCVFIKIVYVRCLDLFEKITIYLCLIPQPHMLSKRMTAFRVLIVTYVDAIEEFLQPGNCYNCPHCAGQL